MSKKIKRTRRKIKYAIVGLGHIAQNAVLPAFRHAKNAELVALISADKKKLAQLSKKYNVPFTGSYGNYEDILTESGAEAVYIALPNTLHHEYVIRAFNAGVHVLCEKPLATTFSNQGKNHVWLQGRFFW
jgi:glucose-fructose oxidoreductase